MLYFPCFYIYKNLIFKIKGTNTLLIFVHSHSKICIKFVSIYVCRSKVSIDVFQQKNPAKATGSSCGVGGVRLKGDPEGMDHARDVGEEGEDDVEEEVASASADQQNRDGREDEGKDESTEPGTVTHVEA